MRTVADLTVRENIGGGYTIGYIVVGWSSMRVSGDYPYAARPIVRQRERVYMRIFRMYLSAGHGNLRSTSWTMGLRNGLPIDPSPGNRMEQLMGAFVFGTWFFGVLVALSVSRSRSGIGFWTGRIKIFGPDGYGVVWVVWTTLTGLFWPITLVVWLARGRPEPRIVFNEKAEERRRQQLS